MIKTVALNTRHIYEAISNAFMGEPSSFGWWAVLDYDTRARIVRAFIEAALAIEDPFFDPLVTFGSLFSHVEYSMVSQQQCAQILDHVLQALVGSIPAPADGSYMDILCNYRVAAVQLDTTVLEHVGTHPQR